MMRGQDWTPVVVTKKSQTPGPSGYVNTKKDPVIKTLDPTCRTEMIQARVAQKLTQDELNTRAQLPKYSIREIESGRLCPSAGQMNILSRILRIPLRYAK